MATKYQLKYKIRIVWLNNQKMPLVFLILALAVTNFFKSIKC